MKTFLAFLAAVVATVNIWAQSPQKMSYQAVIRNTSNQLVINQPIGIRISILQSSALSGAVYTETQVTSTNAIGLLSIEIGGGAGFDAIDWASGPFFIKTETDPEGGTNYTITNTSQLLSVPFALHAKTAETIPGGITETDPVFSASPARTISELDIANWNSKQNKVKAGKNIIISRDTIIATRLPTNGTAPGEMLYWNGNVWVIVPPGTHGKILYFCNGVPTWGGCPSLLTTASVYSITTTTATSGGCVTNNGGSPVTARGACWSTLPNPTITSSITTDGSDTGTFISSLTNLTPNTMYFVRTYATNSTGTVYGNEVSFTTPPLNESTACFSAPDGVVSSGSCVGWSYKDYIIPEGYKVDSVFMDASRPGYPQDEYDLIIGYCSGKTSFNPSAANFPLDYTETTSPMYKIWLDLMSYNIYASGIVRITLPTCNGAIWNTLCFAISPLKPSTECFTAPDGINEYKWSYKDYVIPDGYKLDSIYMDANRAGYPEYQYDLNLAYCPESTTYNYSVAIFPINYNTIATTMYNTWIDLTNLSIKAAGMIRVKLPTGEGAVWNRLCLAISEIKVSIPSVRTIPITNISFNTATVGGEVLDNGGNKVIWCGVCMGKSPNPTTNDMYITADFGTGVFVCNLSGLNSATLYYVRAFAINSAGTAYGNEVSFTTKPSEYSIGQKFGGGIIFYIDSTVEHGLIAAENEYITSAEWGCNDTEIGGTNDGIGTGKANTLAIVNGCSQSNIAARICSDLVLNGYDDWFLPSHAELVELCNAQIFNVGYDYPSYWSSTEAGNSDAICYSCGHYDTTALPKEIKFPVRAVRAF